MSVVYLFVSYLVLALVIPICWSLVPVWRRAREARHVDCPDASRQAMVKLDPWFAARKHALGDWEFRVQGCTQWPQRRDCGQKCLVRISM